MTIDDRPPRPSEPIPNKYPPSPGIPQTPSPPRWGRRARKIDELYQALHGRDSRVQSLTGERDTALEKVSALEEIVAGLRETRDDAMAKAVQTVSALQEEIEGLKFDRQIAEQTETEARGLAEQLDRADEVEQTLARELIVSRALLKASEGLRAKAIDQAAGLTEDLGELAELRAEIERLSAELNNARTEALDLAIEAETLAQAQDDELLQGPE